MKHKIQTFFSVEAEINKSLTAVPSYCLNVAALRQWSLCCNWESHFQLNRQIIKSLLAAATRENGFIPLLNTGWENCP